MINKKLIYTRKADVDKKLCYNKQTKHTVREK